MGAGRERLICGLMLLCLLAVRSWPLIAHPASSVPEFGSSASEGVDSREPADARSALADALDTAWSLARGDNVLAAGDGETARVVPSRGVLAGAFASPWVAEGHGWLALNLWRLAMPCLGGLAAFAFARRMGAGALGAGLVALVWIQGVGEPRRDLLGSPWIPLLALATLGRRSEVGRGWAEDLGKGALAGAAFGWAWLQAWEGACAGVLAVLVARAARVVLRTSPTEPSTRLAIAAGPWAVVGFGLASPWVAAFLGLAPGEWLDGAEVARSRARELVSVSLTEGGPARMPWPLLVLAAIGAWRVPTLRPLAAAGAFLLVLAVDPAAWWGRLPEPFGRGLDTDVLRAPGVLFLATTAAGALTARPGESPIAFRIAGAVTLGLGLLASLVGAGERRLELPPRMPRLLAAEGEPNPVLGRVLAVPAPADAGQALLWRARWGRPCAPHLEGSADRSRSLYPRVWELAEGRVVSDGSELEVELDLLGVDCVLVRRDADSPERRAALETELDSLTRWERAPSMGGAEAEWTRWYRRALIARLP